MKDYTKTNEGIFWEKYDEPIVKSYLEIEPGDIFECEYGDFGNFVKVIFEYNELTEGDWVNSVGRYLTNTKMKFSGYDWIKKDGRDYKVIGKVVNESGIS